MSLHAFQQFSPPGNWVLHQSTFLANRWDDENDLNLYYCAGDGRGFFVEAGINDGQGQALVLRSVSDSEALAA